eukprot:2272817-Ditylum_brightwellii.AAC.1
MLNFLNITVDQLKHLFKYKTNKRIQKFEEAVDQQFNTTKEHMKLYANSSIMEQKTFNTNFNNDINEISQKSKVLSEQVAQTNTCINNYKMKVTEKINDLNASKLEQKFTQVETLLNETQEVMTDIEKHNQEYIKILDCTTKTNTVTHQTLTNFLIKKYPLLTPFKFKPHHQTFGKNLEHIKLKSDQINHIEFFWNKIKNA